ncbi:MAG: 50S ribosomal protein L28 [Dehalococcoidia bacterium]|nr:50S ribosomal protein L28 [Dehalococcoidia bacterium]
MAMCELCGVHRRAGKNVSHSNRHTNRWFFPNIQRATLTIRGKRKRMHICTRCLRTYQNRLKIA